MLKNVHLKNFAIINEADIEFGDGLNILTGETGAGKSVIISAVNIGLGGRAEKTLIRSGSDFALVEITFTNVSEKVKETAYRKGISVEGNTVTVTRKITSDAGISRINGETVTLADIRILTDTLADVHGQHDHQSLLDCAKHLEIIDAFGGQELSARMASFREIYGRYKKLKERSRDFSLDDEALEREKDFLEFEKKEIEDSELTLGEDEELEREFRELERRRSMSESLIKVSGALNDEENGMAGAVAKASQEMAHLLSLSGEDKDIAALSESLSDIDALTADFRRDLSSYTERHAFDGARYEQIRKRLDIINRLKSKYAPKTEEILSLYDEICAKLKELENYTENRDKINAELSYLRSELNKSADDLSAVRRETADALSEKISENLKELNFMSVDFSAEFTKNAKISEKGYDRAEFMISLNPGESKKPLGKVASGGELSRIMLAIKSSVADNDDIPTLIFDEIDSGISGKTAQAVARKMKSLSKSRQIICITHLPQIAAFSDEHFLIHKEAAGGRAISGVERLSEERSTEEIARLLSGESITEASLENARALKMSAKN